MGLQSIVLRISGCVLIEPATKIPDNISSPMSNAYNGYTAGKRLPGLIMNMRSSSYKV